jgi:hypothetical protein
MKTIFLDHDSVICLPAYQWGTRHTKEKKWSKKNPDIYPPYNCLVDNFDTKCVKALNKIISETDCEIVVSSDWRKDSTLEELQGYYTEQGIIKKPIAFTCVYDHTIDRHHHSLFKNSFIWDVRSIEILKYVMENKLDKWLAIDDLNLSDLNVNTIVNPDRNHFFRTYSDEGIKKSGLADKIIKELSK